MFQTLYSGTITKGTLSNGGAYLEEETLEVVRIRVAFGGPTPTPWVTHRILSRISPRLLRRSSTTVPLLPRQLVSHFLSSFPCPSTLRIYLNAAWIKRIYLKSDLEGRIGGFGVVFVSLLDFLPVI